MSKVFNMVGGGGSKNISSIIITGLLSTDTVTCTKDGKSYTTTWDETAQHLEIVGLPLGTFTVTATRGTVTTTETVLIDIAGVYEVEMDFKLWLYRPGDPCEDVTGGWDKVSTKGVVTKYDDRMDLSATEAPGSVTPYYFSTVNGINTKGYKTLYADVSMVNGSDGYFLLGLSGAKTEAFLVATGKGDNTRSTVSVNISAYQGAGFYPEMCVRRRSDFRCVVSVYKIWLE